MVHENRDFEIGETGITLFEGPNGSGKSTVPEGVASLYNASLRAPKSRRNRGFVAKKKGLVRVETYDGLDAQRTCTASGTLGLTYSLRGQTVSFPTPTKALDQFVLDNGSFDVWKRCCYFSSKSAARFTEALDSERRALLEELVAVGDYSVAHAKAQEKEKAFARLAGEKQAALAVAQNQLAVVARDVANAQQGLAALMAPVCPGEDTDLQQLRDLCTKLQAEEQALRAKFAPLDQQRALIDAHALRRSGDAATFASELHQANARVTLLGQGNCPTCAQPIPETMVVDLQGQVSAAQSRVQQHQTNAVAAQTQDLASKASIEADRAALQILIDDVRRRYNETQNEGVRLAADIANYKQADLQHTANRQQWTELVASADQKSRDANDLVNRLKAELADAQRKTAVANAGAWLLGPKGLRAQLLGDVLGSIEMVTNRWLALMDPKLRVELKAYDEDAKATQSAISLKIHGRDAGDEYVDLSTGERLRVDLAFLFGFAEVTELIHGGSATLGTLWLDEVFDGVDDVGVEAAIELIQSVAEKRAVVVISHNEKLKFKLKPDVIYSMKKPVAA
jgi:DNA repair exonuclease SbcCD ATPase subunit